MNRKTRLRKEPILKLMNKGRLITLPFARIIALTADLKAKPLTKISGVIPSDFPVFPIDWDKDKVVLRTRDAPVDINWEVSRTDLDKAGFVLANKPKHWGQQEEFSAGYPTLRNK